MRLNLGCGFRKIEGCVNVDKFDACSPDHVVDLERFPWPWEDDSVEEIFLIHVLEHLGASAEVYLKIIQELYRVSRHGAQIRIIVPHPRHDHFLSDPTHVRPVTREGLSMFSQALNREWLAKGAANTPLGLYLGVDFDIRSVEYQPDERWRGRLERGEITREGLMEAANDYNNVISQMSFLLSVNKAR